MFQAAARYTIGPWKLFGGYEHIQFANPNNPLNPGAFIYGGFIAGTVNNTAFPSDKILQTAWFGARYAITSSLDITGAYYHEWQNSFDHSYHELNGRLCCLARVAPAGAPAHWMLSRSWLIGASPSTWMCMPA